MSKLGVLNLNDPPASQVGESVPSRRSSVVDNPCDYSGPEVHPSEIVQNCADLTIVESFGPRIIPPQDLARQDHAVKSYSVVVNLHRAAEEVSSEARPREKNLYRIALIVVGEGRIEAMSSSSSAQRPAWCRCCARCLPKLVPSLSVDPGETPQVSQGWKSRW